MKTDDPRLEKSHKEALGRAEKHRALKLAVVNNHPMFERCVREFLDASGEQHGHLQLRANSIGCLVVATEAVKTHKK